MIRKLVGILFLATFLLSCNGNKDRLFTNPSSKETGIKFANNLTESNDLNILDYLYFYNGGGVAVGDINNDGLPDIYFSGNQVKNKLYLNKGNLKFEDITEKAGVSGNSSWQTGAIMGDINGDGLLDIYVCAVVGINGFSGYNELYINNGDETFTESAAKFGLDFDTYSSNAAFLDYDLDGDLDIYILNHAVHTQESFGKADVRLKRNYESGDRLMRNDGDKFTDVSKEAGIYGGANGYGLGIAISDFNQDGYPDIYIGNDFHEDDYYYLNNGDGTFIECLKEYFGHTSRFSMGSDVADINHDGWPDLLSLDMLPEDEKVLKSSEGDDNIQVQKLRIERFGYHYQFTRNVLFINQHNAPYTETALLSGIAATDWSWSSLFGDFNQDKKLDLFISNGIPKRPNDLDYIKFVSSKQIQDKIDNTKLVDQEALNLMPSGNTANYIFKGEENLKFQDKSSSWIKNDTLVSGATALADLDNDGDLDMVVNNINAEAVIYLNNTNAKSNYLKLKFNYKEKNKFGIGTKVFAYNKGELQYRELYTVRGFQSSSQPIIHFGYDNTTSVDSLKIIWPDKTYQTLKNVKTNQTLTVSQENVSKFNYSSLKAKKEALFTLVENNLGIDFKHTEDNYIDFNRHKLIPFQVSDRGPATAIGDINNDGKEDIYFGSSKLFSSKIFVQKDSSFVALEIPEILKDSVNEDVVALIADFNKDKQNDIFIGTGGANFYGKSKRLLDNFFVRKDTVFSKQVLPEIFENISVITENDYDKDGDLDIFIGANTVSNDYGKIPNSYMLKNDNGNFSLIEIEGLKNAGMITDAIWSDYNNDGWNDLIVVGEWMVPKFYKNDKGNLKEDVQIEGLNGLWQQVQSFDIDKDGDDDYLLGNWGVNTKFKASKEHPMMMYVSDFDNNGSTETIVCTYKNGNYYPLLGLDELSSQIVSLRKKFTKYSDFAGKPIEEIFDKDELKNASVLKVDNLHSGYLKNNNGSFEFIPFKNELQVAPINTFKKFDFDGDNQLEMLAAGNYFGVKPFHGRFDSFSGAIIKDAKNIILGNKLGLNFDAKVVRHLNVISFKNKPYLVATINNDSLQVYNIKAYE